MNFSFYLFGTPSKRYSQYPDDYTASMLNEMQQGVEGTRLVIYRNMNLMHYVFAERLNAENIIGFCLIINNGFVTKPKSLIVFLRHLIEDVLLKSGDLIRYDNYANIVFTTNSISDKKKIVESLKEALEIEFEQNKDKYKIQELPTTYNGITSCEELDFSASDSQIVSLAEKSNKVIINGSLGVTNAYLPALIEDLKKRLSSALNKISALQSEIDALNKRKKQYKYVVTLSITVLACCVGLYLFYSDVVHKNSKITELEETVWNQRDLISVKNKNIDDLNTKVKSLNNKINDIVQYESSTGATLRNNDSADSRWIMWVNAKRKIQMLSFYVKGGSSSNGEVTIGLYDTSDNLIATVDANVSSSEFRKIYLNSDWVLNSGYYYLRIKEPNGRSLQYHSSNDTEYSQFSGGALEVTGCSSYEDRSSDDAKTKQIFYQYFYNIQYKVLYD